MTASTDGKVSTICACEAELTAPLTRSQGAPVGESVTVEGEVEEEEGERDGEGEEEEGEGEGEGSRPHM